jgi:hypothetical protein
MQLTSALPFFRLAPAPYAGAERGRESRLYGKCNNPYGHGHDYVLDVTVEGAIDANRGRWRTRALDALVAGRVLARLDHKNLNTDVAELADAVATTENLACAIENAVGGLAAGGAAGSGADFRNGSEYF